MANELSKLAKGIEAERIKQTKRFARSSLFVKITLISFFSAIAAIAQFAQFPPEGPGWAQILGILASLVVAIGGVFVVITEQDSTTQLALAQTALEAARDAEAKTEFIYDLEDDLERLIELFQAMLVMRGALEAMTAQSATDEADVAAKILKASGRSLAIALDFAQADQWTISIYMAVADPQEPRRFLLRCIASKRAIECNPSEARVWKEGTGIMGVAFSSGDEIVVPDLQAEGMAAVFGTSANETRAYDSARYRSMTAVPVHVQGMERPWGVVTATNDRAGHFSPNGLDGVRPDEGVRALAGMVALAVAIIRKRATLDKQGE